jgi:hypothetical protein
LLVLAVCAVFSGTDCKARRAQDPAPLGVLFTGWFGFDHATGKCIGGLRSTHWNDGSDTGGIVHTPIAADGEKDPFYCSADPIRVAHQIRLMEDAGVTVLLYSWWGWGDKNLDGTIEGHPDRWINLALTEMLKQLKERRSPIKVAVLVEPFTMTQAGLWPRQLKPHQFQMVLEYLYSHFYGPYADQMYLYDGRPLLSTFDPMYMPDLGLVKPTRLGGIDWWPRTNRATIEVTAAASGSAAQVTVEKEHVRVAVAIDAAGHVTTPAADVVALVQTSGSALPVVGATLPADAAGGVVAPVAETALTRWTELQGDTPAGTTRLSVSGGDGIRAGDLVQLSDRDGWHPEVLRVTARESAPRGSSLTLETPTAHAHRAGDAAKLVDARWTMRWLSSQERCPELDAEGWQWWLVPQQPLATTVSADGMAFLNHRFTEYYLHMAHASYLSWKWRDIDPMLDKGVYEEQWQWALDHRDSLKLVLLYSWNFYGELAQLEPSTLGPAPPGREYLDRTRRYYAQFRAGAKTLER